MQASFITPMMMDNIVTLLIVAGILFITAVHSLGMDY